MKVAGKDIRCMKILEEDQWGYRTPYRFNEVTPEVVRGEKDFTADRSAPGDYVSESRYVGAGYVCVEIGAGAVHTYAYTKDSDKAIRSEVSFLRRQYYCPRAAVVFECVIPEGTEYIEGIYDGEKCYGSKSIRFVRELMRFEGKPGDREATREKIYEKIAENADLFRETRSRQHVQES